MHVLHFSNGNTKASTSRLCGRAGPAPSCIARGGRAGLPGWSAGLVRWPTVRVSKKKCRNVQTSGGALFGDLQSLSQSNRLSLGSFRTIVA